MYFFNAAKAHQFHSTVCLGSGRAARGQDLLLPRIEECGRTSCCRRVLAIPMSAFIDVLTFTGERSMASCLAGGDLDGSVVG